MKKKNKFYHLLAGILLAIPLLLHGVFGIEAVKANGDTIDTNQTVNIHLHKRAWAEGQQPTDPIANTGEEMDFGGDPLNGVTFKAYDVSDDFRKLRKTGSTAEEATKAIQKQADTLAANLKAVDSQKTTGKGLADFNNLPIADANGYKTYLIVETDADADTNVSQPAAPIVLNMPIYKDGSNSEINTNVHVYPKNEKSDEFTKDLDDASKAALKVTVNGETHYNAQYGDTFGYEIKVAVPWSVKNKDTFTITDTPDKGIKVDLDSVAIEGLEKVKDYTVATNGDGYKVTFDTQSSAVQKMAGKRLSVKYNVTLTNDAVPDTLIGNEATLGFGNKTTPDYNDTTVPGPDIETGGARFIKQDKDSNKTLAGAKFQLVKLNKEGNVTAYAHLTDKGYVWEDTAANAQSYTSDDNGQIAIPGLTWSKKEFKNGESYALVETKAPEGYAKLSDPVKFTVEKGSYSKSRAIEIDNVHKGILPSTGGHGIYLYLLAGVLIVIVAATGYHFSKHREEV
ncbi:SpaH/EbpB family LPXTG-anchored major pilin [Ligilactobacillus pobuzihii]|uniref:Orf2 n=1 Tax=Ligilactobacillus pobuzihii TaxID=449659 RepID=A0A0R2LGX0_9LACO|nr:SpaH/EbpB family LPXTG-anchored major pilin [Ligilactobacillus pobuzihii]KRK09837.1 orf2 [Ligilactobacillus pobuzihii E100301 = KCTC 13174]KRO00679.1 orf2 [Ligilactobacillus pobuzihii]GEN48570.1 peptidase [Ligilactobacillus pobuzihii]